MIEKLGRLVGWGSVIFTSGIMIGIILALFPASKLVSAQVTCYSLTLAGIPAEGGIPTASPTNSEGCNPKEYVSGATITLDPGTNAGFVFDSWTGASITVNTLTMPGAITSVTANYEVTGCYTLSLIHTGNGSNPTASPIKSDGCNSGRYTAGEVITLTPLPGTDYHLSSWSGGTVDASHRYTMIASDDAIFAIYNPDTMCHSLTLAGNPPAGGTPIVAASTHGCISKYEEGETVTLTRGTNSGYTFATWSSTPTVTFTSDTFPMPISDITVTANYLQCYTLSLAHTGTGSNPTANPSNSTGCASGKYITGEVITLSPIPGTNYHLSTWSGATVDTSYRYTMAATDSVIIANYNPDTTCHTLTLAGNPPTGGTPTKAASTRGCGSQYEEGETVTLTRGTNTGFTYSSWSSTPTVTFTSDTFPMPTADITVTANYSEKAGCHTLFLEHTGTGSNPTASPTNSTGCIPGRYIAAEAITIAPIPGTNYHLSTWSGATVSASYHYTMGVTDITITANYNPDTKCHTMTLAGNPSAGGTPTAAASLYGCGNKYEEGETVTLTKGINSGYVFLTWSSTPSVTFTSDTFPMPTSDITVTANYERTGCHTLSLEHAGTGSNPTASPTNSTGCNQGRYLAGAVITLSSIPDSGYHLRTWSGGTVTSNQYIMVSSDTIITADYVSDTKCHTMTLAGNPSAGGTPTAAASLYGCGNKYEEGETVTLTKGINSGYVFLTWSSTPSVTFTSDTFPMPISDITVTANYDVQNFCNTQMQIDPTECEGLRTLYNNTGGNTTWTNKTYWLVTYTPCSWYGVSCGSGHVTGLSLGNNKLANNLPDIFGSLPHLSWILLNNNNLTGSIPTSIGSLTSLGRLYLQYNTLSGALPDFFSSLTSLTDLRINNNPSLSGSLPSSLKNRKNMQTLYFGTTGLCEPSDILFQGWLMQ
ncbi:MAG: InlB B-repeat-containing protein, partial [Chloroflexota bacterium]